MKRHYKVVLTSDEERSEVDLWLTLEEAKFLVGLAQKVNRNATWTADIRMAVVLAEQAGAA